MRFGLLFSSALVLAAACAPSRPLIVAAQRGDSAAVDSLIAAREPLDAYDQNGLTALMRAAGRGDLAIVQKLVAAGASVTLPSRHSGLTALMRAAGHKGSPEVIRFLLAHGASVDERSRLGMTPLMYAASAGRIDLAQALLAAGADPNARARNGKTALSVAKFRRNPAMIRLLAGSRPGGAQDADAEASASPEETAPAKEKQWFDE